MQTENRAVVAISNTARRELLLREVEEAAANAGPPIEFPITDYFSDVESLPVVEELFDDESDGPWSLLLGVAAAVSLVLSLDELFDEVLSAGALILPLAPTPAGLFASFP